MELLSNITQTQLWVLDRVIIFNSFFKFFPCIYKVLLWSYLMSEYGLAQIFRRKKMTLVSMVTTQYVGPHQGCRLQLQKCIKRAWIYISKYIYDIFSAWRRTYNVLVHFYRNTTPVFRKDSFVCNEKPNQLIKKLQWKQKDKEGKIS